MDKPKSHSKALEEFRLAKFEEMTATINALTAERDALKAEVAAFHAEVIDLLETALEYVSNDFPEWRDRYEELTGEPYGDGDDEEYDEDEYDESEGDNANPTSD